MSQALDEGLVQRVDARGTTAWSGECFRYTAAHRDPLSGEGARRFGGRWNPPLLFPAIYLADSARACMVEVERAADAHRPQQRRCSKRRIDYTLSAWRTWLS